MGVDGSLTHDVSDVDCGVLMYDRNERELVQGTCDEPDDENGDEGDDPEEEEDGESDEDEINEDDALGESDESDEESDSGSEEENLDEDAEEEASDEEKNVDEDTEEEESGDDDDKSEEARSKDVKVSTGGVISAQPSEQNKQNKHVVFDEEESENLPLTEFMVGSSKSEDGEPEDSDSDAAPEEVTLAAGKKLADGEDIKIKKELERTKQLIKEARKRKHEKNKLQQEQKRQRLENLSSKRLPEELLKAVVAEQKIQPRQKVAIQKKKGKVKTFTDDCIADSDPADENVDEEGLITLQHGVHVRAVKQEIKKNISIANQAAEFRQKALYGMRIKRMPSKELQQMKVRQEKSGKNFLVTR